MASSAERSRKSDQRRKAAGLCVNCPTPAARVTVGGAKRLSVFCERHLLLAREKAKAGRARLKAKTSPRDARQCGQMWCKEPAVEGGYYCQRHRDKRREYNKTWKRRQRARGRCVQCRAKAVRPSFCQKHWDQRKRLAKRRLDRKRERAVCSVCAEAATRGRLCQKHWEQRTRISQRQYAKRKAERLAARLAREALAGGGF